VAFGALFGIFFLYEALDLWASPALTAWVIIAYFVASFALEAVFTESAFCKYVCPLGTFNFVYSAISPFHIRARSAEVCRTCVGRECINGSYRESPVILIDQIQDGVPIRQHTNGPDGVLGCGTLLYVPQMRGNQDCVFCLDCARACPHDNVALAARAPWREILDPRAWPKRWDVGFLLVALAFMGLSNAFGMVPPVYALLAEVSRLTGITTEWILLLALFLVSNLLLPGAAGLGAAWLAVRLAGDRRSRALRDTFAAFAPAFIPIGLGIWLAHYGFHFIIGARTIVPAFQTFLIENGLGWPGLQPDYSVSSLLSIEQFAIVQVVMLVGGYLASMLTARAIAVQRFGKLGKSARRNAARAQAAFIVYAVLFLLIMFAALWVFDQPMEMRGSLLMDGPLH
jgi:ferredoxin